MEKVELLFNELMHIKTKNLVKFFIIETMILIIVIGSYLTNISDNLKIILTILLLLIFFLQILLYFKKQKAILYCQENYRKNPNDVIKKLENRTTYFLDVFDYTNETLLFKEIMRRLRTYKLYKDKNQIGPWEIIYHHQNTKTFSEKTELKDKMSVIEVSKKLEGLNEKVKTLLASMGINYHHVYDVWDNRFSSKEEFELMYPIFGFILNDSQVLNGGLKYKAYRIDENTVIKPYERTLDDEDVIMLHIKTKL